MCKGISGIRERVFKEGKRWFNSWKRFTWEEEYQCCLRRRLYCWRGWNGWENEQEEECERNTWNGIRGDCETAWCSDGRKRFSDLRERIELKGTIIDWRGAKRVEKRE